MKTSIIEFTNYNLHVIDGEGKTSVPFTLRGFSKKERVEVKNCVFDNSFFGFDNPSDLILIEPKDVKIG